MPGKEVYLFWIFVKIQTRRNFFLSPAIFYPFFSMEKDLFSEPLFRKKETPQQQPIIETELSTKRAVEKIISGKDFEKLFDKISYGLSEWRVFNDFLDMCIYAFSLGKYEEQYFEIVKRYPKEKVNQLAELLSLLILAMTRESSSKEETESNYSAGAKDILGELYELRFSNSKSGQFFTPQPIADFMAMASCGDSKEFEHKTVCDPACGSGRMLLAAKKINPFNHFYGADLDETCCKMATINLFLNGVKGEIAHMNSLSMEFYKSYKLTGMPFPSLTITTNKAESVFFTTVEKIKEKEPEKFEQPFVAKVGLGGQLELF
jgi:type I restriction-modification system DNA methylase subunit